MSPFSTMSFSTLLSLLPWADWAAVVPLDGSAPLAVAGPEVPTDAWLGALVAGATAGTGSAELGAVSVVRLERSEAALVVAREHLPLRGREQRVLVRRAGWGSSGHEGEGTACSATLRAQR